MGFSGALVPLPFIPIMWRIEGMVTTITCPLPVPVDSPSEKAAPGRSTASMNINVVIPWPQCIHGAPYLPLFAQHFIMQTSISWRYYCLFELTIKEAESLRTMRSHGVTDQFRQLLNSFSTDFVENRSKLSVHLGNSVRAPFSDQGVAIPPCCRRRCRTGPPSRH
jgi:hypothetical protein